MDLKATILALCAAVILLASAGPGISATASKPAEALQLTVKKPVISGPLSAAFKRCEKLADVKIVVDWDALRATGVDEQKKVTLKASSATVGQLLDLMLIQVAAKGSPLSWYVDNDVVRVTTQKRVLVAARLSLPVLSSRPQTAPAPRPAVMRELSFDEVPLSEVIDYFRDLSGLNFHVNWRALELVNVDRSTPITLKLSNATTAQALDLVTDQLSASRDRLDRVYWVVDGGVVLVSTGAALNTQTKVRTFDVTDLLMVVPDFRGPQLSLENAGRTGSETDRTGTQFGGSLFESDEGTTDEQDANENGDSAEQRARIRENLIGIIKDSIGEEMWQPLGPGSITMIGNRLVISQSILGFKLLEDGHVLP